MKEKLKIYLESKFIDIEPELRKRIKEKRSKLSSNLENCKNIFYYGYDGHINEEGHIQLYDVL